MSRSAESRLRKALSGINTKQRPIKNESKQLIFVGAVCITIAFVFTGIEAFMTKTIEPVTTLIATLLIAAAIMGGIIGLLVLADKIWPVDDDE